MAKTRGVAVVNTNVTDEELKKLNAVGVRGIRFNLVQAGATSMEMVMPLSKRIHALGWHIQINAMPETIVAGADVWNNVPCPVVFDHLGHVVATDSPALNVITELMKKGKGWVKLSGVYMDSKVGPPTYADMVEIGKVYVKVAPGQVVWGSDWPHPTEKPDNKPDDAILLDLLTDMGAGCHNTQPYSGEQSGKTIRLPEIDDFCRTLSAVACKKACSMKMGLAKFSRSHFFILCAVNVGQTPR